MQSPSPPAVQPKDSFIVSVAPAEPAAERTVGDVLIGSFAIVGLLLLVAVVLGGVLGAVRYGWIKRHPPGSDHMPPVKPTS